MDASNGKVRTLRLNPKQHAFIFSPARFSFYVGGRGAGKTYSGALRAIFAAQEMPGSLGLVGAPTHPMLRDAAQRMFFELCPRRLIRSHSKTEQHTWLKNGSEILWRPAFEYDRYRGLNLAWFWLDEAPWCGYEAWKVLKATLRQAGYDGRRAWATGTPRGRDGYAKDFELARRNGHALYRASTRENLHNLPEGFIEDLGYEGQFAEQEIEGLFVAFDGLVYSFDGSTWEDSGGHIRSYHGDGFARVVGGIDWGYTNPTAAVVFGLDGDRRAWQLDEFYQRRAGDEVRLPAIVGLTKQYKVARWYADSEDPEAIDKLNRALADEGLTCRATPAVKGAGSVRAGIQTVTAALAKRSDGTRGLYVDPRCIHTIAEYGSYAYATSTERAKRDPAEEPLKQSDHSLDATRYCLHGELAGVARVEAYLAEMQRYAAGKKGTVG